MGCISAHRVGDLSNKASACVEGARMWNSAVSSTVILKVITKGDSNLLQRAL
jgi:hypothetical protein